MVKESENALLRLGFNQSHINTKWRHPGRRYVIVIVETIAESVQNEVRKYVTKFKSIIYPPFMLIAFYATSAHQMA